ncbi:MAG: sel1 repeat family protein [Rhizobiales bacterium]|nr:sel1 repeat family protein [Hyphomicrobiales bacterium]NRB12975.1 sel1 repeat family protein [Hyphomicrobiales bacterium]
MKPIFTNLILIPISIIFLTNSALADYKTGISLHKQQQYTLALAEFTTAANDGHRLAQYMLGVYYSAGHAVDADQQIAKSWYEKSANQNYSYAQNNLGNFYATGRGDTELDYDIAIFWYKKAAAQGDMEAVYNLGQMYEFGFGYAINIPRAIEKYTMAGALAHADAQYRLALIYAYGKGGLDIDYNLAKTWLHKAAENGNEDALKTLRELISMGFIKG